MPDLQVIVEHMDLLARQWQAAADRRWAFLECYRMMTCNTLAALDGGEFLDRDWLRRLLQRFASYYFDAIELYEHDPLAAPAVWRLTFQAACDPRPLVLQHLLLGINTHINHDLVLALVDILQSEWAQLPEWKRQERYADHCHINDVIRRTVDLVQETVIERLNPELNWIDAALGPLDEWLAARLIRIWRDDVWHQALRFLQASDSEQRQSLHRELEAAVIERANLILLERI